MKKKFSTILRQMAQPETGGVRTTEDEGNTLETPSDDEVITIPSQEREDLRKVNIRGEHLENTQREDWLLPTEPRHGTRPRQTGAEHPPATDSVFKEAADLPSTVRHRNGTLRLSPGRRIDMEEEVFTSPRGGAIRPLSLRMCKVRHELGLRLFRRPLSEMWWTVAAFGKAMPTRRLAGRENLLRI